MPSLDVIVKEIAEEMRQRTDRGEVASYIPELAGVDVNAFGLAVIDAEGNVAAGGDADTPFSIQSIHPYACSGQGRRPVMAQGRAGAVRQRI
jgi:glutaminase